METSKMTASPTDRDTQHVPKGMWRTIYRTYTTFRDFPCQKDVIYKKTLYQFFSLSLSISLSIYIRHVPSGTCCVSRSVESSIHSLSSTSFQVELGAPGGGGSSSPFLWSFLRGGTRDPARPPPPPPSRPPKIQLFRSSAASCALVRQPWRQDVQTSPKIAKKTPSWSQHLPT